MKTDLKSGGGSVCLAVVIAGLAWLAGGVLCAAADCVNAPAGLVAWWRCEGNGSDMTGANNGTLVGATAVAGQVGEALNFNGADQKVAVPDNDALKLTNSLAIECWIFPRANGFILFRGDSRPGLDPYALTIELTHELQFLVTSASGESMFLRTPGAVPMNQWLHVAASLDGATGDARVYLNGTLAAQTNTTIRPFRDLDSNYGPGLGIGGHAGNYDYFSFDGTIDELSIYNRALASNEVAAIFAAGAAGKCVPVAPPAGPPVIMDFSPKSGTNGTTITLTGTNFSPVAPSNIVYLGALRATVMSASATSLTVLVPAGTTFAAPTVTVGGLTAFACAPFMPTFNGGNATISSSSFAPRVDISNPIGAHRTVIADLDGDGKPDLAVSGGVQHGVSLYRNVASAGTLDASSFAPRVDILTLPVADSPWDLVAADVDGDGKLDLLEANRGDNKVSILRNISTPGSLSTNSFAPSVDLSVGDLPLGIVVRDLDGDGRVDLAVGNFNSGNVAVLRNIGAAGALSTNSFAAPVSFTTEAGTHSLIAEDLDGDGKPDLAAVNANANSVSILRNTSTPGTINSDSFAPQFSLATPDYTHHVESADIDGDGKLDLLTASVHGHAMSVFRNIATPGALNSGSFAARVGFPLAGRGHTISLGDLNGDNKVDVVVDTEIGDAVSVFQNLSTPGSFTTASLGARVDLATGWNAWGASVGDLDGDGRPDIVFANTYDNTVSVYRNVSPLVNDPTALPAVTVQPLDQTVAAGSVAQFNVTATGAEPLAYQWFKANDPLAGETAGTLTLMNVQPGQAGNYHVVVSNAYGVATSSNALLTVLTYPPTITVEPPDQSVYAGRPVSVRVQATGTAPLRYRWDKDGTPIANATNASYLISNVQFSDAGNYRAIITNDYGSATSRVALLTVRTPPPCGPVPSGAVAWWPGQSNTWDVLGGYDGVWTNTIYAGYSTGKVGSAFRFTGAFLNVNHTGELDLGAGGGLTVEAWIQPNGTSVMPVFEWNDGAANIGAGLMLNVNGAGRIEAVLTDTNAPKRVVTLRSSASVITNLLWQHVALTYDKTAGLAQILVNGVVVAQTNAPGLRLLTSTPLSLGNRRSGSFSGARFQGAMDEISLYNRALSVAEVQAIVAADETGKCEPPAPPCVPPATGIAAWWRGESNTLDSVAGNHARTVPSNYPVALTYQTGLVSSAFAFRGQNFLSVPKSDNLDVGKESGLTVEGWILPTQSRPMPIMEWTDSNSFGASLWMSYYRGPTVLEANLMDAFGGVHLIQSPVGALINNAWQHVALTYNKASGQAALFVNGNTVAATNLGSFTPRTDLPLMLGAHPPNASYSGVTGSPPAPASLFFGAMDEIAQYRRALNPAEIRNLARVRPGKCLDLPPTIGSQPQDVVALENGAAAFNVIAGGSPTLAYRWFSGDQPISGATSATLTMTRVQLSDAGVYSAVVSNAFGVATSRTANLIVLPANQCVLTLWGAVAFWRGESNTVDELGNHPAAWGSNTPVAYTSAQTGGGKVNTAFRFGGSSYLQVPGNADLNVAGGGGFTIEGWIKPDSIGGPQPVVDWNDGKGNVGVGLMYGRTGPGVLEVTMTDTNAYLSTERIVTFATPIYTIGSPTNPIPAWTHVALTFDRVSGKASLFVNGKSVAERTIGPVQASPAQYPFPYPRLPFTPATTGNLYFGWRPSGLYSGPRFRGAMDEMTVYYRSLTPLELQTIYVAGTNGKCAPQPACWPVTTDAVAWWRGEQNLRDSVGVNDGTNFNGSIAYTNGVAGSALRFTSQGGYVRFPVSSELDVGAGPGLTFEAWVKPEPLSFTSSGGTMAGWGSGTELTGTYFEVGGGSFSTRGTLDGIFRAHFVDAVGNGKRFSASFNVNTNTGWQHLAVTYDKATGLGVLFANGAPILATNLGVFTPRTTGQLQLGYPATFVAGIVSPRYLGGMDEVMLHRRALSAGEITASYRNVASRCMEPPAIVQQPVGMRVNAGSDVTLSVRAVGSPVLRYQWFQGRSPVYDFGQKLSTNAQKPTLTLTNVAEWRQGAYSVVVTNAFGFAVSSNATLLVNYPPVADASATVPLVIAPNNTGATVVLDGSKSSDPDRDPLLCQWFNSGVVAPMATGVVAVVALPVGVHPVELVVDDGLLTDRDALTVEVLSPAQAVARLISAVEAAPIRPLRKLALMIPLRLAREFFERNRFVAGVVQLEIFKRQLQRLVAVDDPILASQLTAEAQAIIAAVKSGWNGSALEQLLAIVRASELPEILRHRLEERLLAAIAAAQQGGPAAAASHLANFIKDTQAASSGAHSELASLLVADAQNILASLEKPRGHIRPAAIQEAGRMRMEFAGNSGKTYLVEASADLVNWEKIGVAVEKTPEAFEFEDLHADEFSCRYYRIVTPQ